MLLHLRPRLLEYFSVFAILSFVSFTCTEYTRVVVQRCVVCMRKQMLLKSRRRYEHEPSVHRGKGQTLFARDFGCIARNYAFKMPPMIDVFLFEDRLMAWLSSVHECHRSNMAGLRCNGMRRGRRSFVIGKPPTDNVFICHSEATNNR